MNMKKYLSLLLVGLFFVVPVSILFTSETKVLNEEKRETAFFPSFPQKISSRNIKTYFHLIDVFLADHFPLRARFFAVYSHLFASEFSGISQDKCIVGKENWLFLGNYYAHTIDRLIGKWRYSGKALTQRIDDYAALDQLATSRQIPFIMLIAPNKSSIYPEFLPDFIRPVPRKFYQDVSDGLLRRGVALFDVTQALRDAKDKGILYYRSDSHWNLLGAHVAFTRLAEFANKKFALNIPTLEDMQLKPAGPFVGGLVGIGGYKNYQPLPGDNYITQMPDVEMTSLEYPITQDTELLSLPENSDKIFTVTNRHALTDMSLWVLGDSFATALRPYVSVVFETVVYVPHKRLEEVLASERKKPDLILWEVVERHF